MVSQVESLKMHRDPVIPLLGVPSRPGTFAHFHPTLSYQKTGYILHWTTTQQWKRQRWYRPTQSILLKERELVAESSTCKWTTKESKGVVRSSGESRPVLLCFSMQQCNMPFPTTPYNTKCGGQFLWEKVQSWRAPSCSVKSPKRFVFLFFQLCLNSSLLRISFYKVFFKAPRKNWIYSISCWKRNSHVHK